jgi:hypothetical protein
MHLLSAGVEPVPRTQIGARQLRHAEHVAIKGETLLRVGDADGDMVDTGWLHRSILPRSHLTISVFGWMPRDRPTGDFDCEVNEIPSAVMLTPSRLRDYWRWWTPTGGPGPMAKTARPAATADRTCQAPWYCHKLSGRHSGDPERPAA